MNTPRTMQLLQVKMNGHLLEGGRLSDCADKFMRMVVEEEELNSKVISRTLRRWKKQIWHYPSLGVGMSMRQQSLARLMRGWRVMRMMKKKKKQIGINHTQEVISHGRQPAGQVEGEQKEGRGRR
jgi:hypothetical protein